MKQLFYKYPKTIGEELEAQIKYCKSIGNIKNNDNLSLKMRELEKEVFGEERKYTIEEVRSPRSAVITELKKISINEEISNYFLLFNAFKALNIIKEDYNIIFLLDYYNIKPKKKIDKERLEHFRKMSNEITRYNFRLCNSCYDKEKINVNKGCALNCIVKRIKEKIKELNIDEQMKFLYKIGIPSSYFNMVSQINGRYYISLLSLKKILEEIEEKNILNKINIEEENYKKNIEKSIKLKEENIESLNKKIEKYKIELKNIEEKKAKNRDNRIVLNEKLKIEKTLNEYVRRKKSINNKSIEDIEKIKMISKIKEICNKLILYF